MLDVLVANLGNLLTGAVVTLYLSAASAVLAAAIGIVVALLQLYADRVTRAAVVGYLTVVRGVPLLVMLFAMYYMLPYAGIDLGQTAGGILVIAIYFAAFMSEVFRAAILAVPRGQWDAARALGMYGRILMAVVIVPQAVRLAGPPFLNTCIMLVKGTSLVSIIGLWEVTMSGRQIVERTLAPFQIFGGVALIYFAICYCLSLCARHLERRWAYAH